MAGSAELSIEGDVATLAFRNPDKLNAITGAMLSEFDEGLSTIEADPGVRVVLIRAAPARAFSSGADVREWSGLSAADLGRRWIRQGNRVFSRLAALDAVTISVINAPVYGGGLELALATDFRIASFDAKFGLPETGIGAIPGWLGVARLTAIVGLARARRAVLLGEILDAATALTWGLVDVMTDGANLEAEIQRMVAAVRGRSGVAIGAAKRIFASVADMERLAAMHELAGSVCRASPDGEEGLEAFKAKRKPDFSRGA
ncbi:MAG: enoyl-CoA hydratase/isomerase family protein [Methylobacteriaceae bacterium]|nr:enoyl-CoA hydratase/isomerase family protein [Methylobacteriaceae bacterium]